MAKIQNYPVLDFSGGVRRDKSFFDFQKNELLDARNVDIDEKGRIYVRRGSHQIGQTLTNPLENSFCWERVVGGSTPVNSIYVNDVTGSGTFYILRTSRLATALTTASTTIVVAGVASSVFSASGTVEIEGDLIAYTNNDNTTTLSGVTGIVGNHPAGASVNQWVALSGTPTIDTRGCSYTVVGNIMIFGGGNLGYIDNDNGTTVSAVSSEPTVLNLVTYRDRAYGSGNGGAGTNGDPRRVSFSNRGDGTTWTTSTDYFDVNDTRGEGVTGFKVTNDILLIFKTNSTFTYDEVELKQRLSSVGAWNHKVPIEIDGIVYTFCPRGIFATNGFSAKQIGEPVRQYWENFQPEVDASANRVVTNTFAARYKDNYILYIHDITAPSLTVDVALVYNTTIKKWTVYTGLTNFQHLLGTEKFRYGDRALQFRSALFGGNSSGQYFRFFETRYIDGQSTPVNQGTDILTDLVSNTTLSGGTPIPASIETPLYDLTHPELFKTFKRLRVYTENGQWNFEYRTQDEKGIGPYKQLGITDKVMKVLLFPSGAQGYRCGFRISAINSGSQGIFNGFVFEDTEVNSRK